MFAAGLSGPGNDDDDDNDNDEDDTNFLGDIQSVLSNEHELVADISLGARSNHSCSEHDDVKWYGYLRLLVYARGSDFATKLRQNSIGIAVAVGAKPTSRSKKTLTNNSSLGYTQYFAHGSPDKGAVCLVIRQLRIVAVCAHLAGTNKYGVAERTFDRIRHRQLHMISQAVEDSIRNIGGGDESIDAWQKIVAGDLNFRVEVHDEAEHKCRGGKDWMAVADLVQCEGEGDSRNYQQEVAEMFRCHDRLVKYLEKGPLHLMTGRDEGGAVEEGEALAIPKLLNSMVDLIRYKCFDAVDSRGSPDIIMPTFSFQIGSDEDVDASGSRRLYSDKRTPSWPDRILMSRELVENDEARCSTVAVGSCPGIALSDHCPVWSFTVCSHVAEDAH